MQLSTWNVCKRHRLRRLLSHQPTTLRDVAQAAGIDPATVSGYLSGKISISLERIDLLCGVVGVDPALLDRPVVVQSDIEILSAIANNTLRFDRNRWTVDGRHSISKKYLVGLIDEGFVLLDGEQVTLTEAGRQALESPDVYAPRLNSSSAAQTARSES